MTMNDVVANAILIGNKTMPDVIDGVIKNMNFISCIEEEYEIPVNSNLPVKKKYGILIDFTMKMPNNEIEFHNHTLKLYNMFGRMNYYHC